MTIPSVAAATDSRRLAAASLLANAASPALNAAAPTPGNTENSPARPVSSSRVTTPRGPASSTSPPASWARSRAPGRVGLPRPQPDPSAARVRRSAAEPP